MRKKTIYAQGSLYRTDMKISAFEFGEGEKSVCIVGALRGNEMQQIFTCSRIIKKLKEIEECIIPGKSIMVVPCANPSSANIGTRFWPTDNTDINRMFPGYDLGETTQRVAAGLFNEISDYKYGMQFVSSYIPGDYIPHVKMMKTGLEHPRNAVKFGLPYVVLREPKPFDTTTLNYNWQLWNCEAYSLFSTSTAKLDEACADTMVSACLRFMNKQGILNYEPDSEDLVSEIVLECEENSIKNESAGFLRLKRKAGEWVNTGDVIAEILDPYECVVKEEIISEKNGRIFYSCRKTLCFANTVIAKII